MVGADQVDLIRQLEQASSDLAGRIRRLEKHVDPLLSRIYSIFPAYTDHTRSHSAQVMNILGWLLPTDMADPLSAQEMFYLLGGALLHDIGMLDACDKVGDLEAQKQIRDSHHLRSEQYVREHYQELELDKPESDAIGEICRSHRKINIAESVSDIPDSRGKLIRMQLLCAAIRIADELHLTTDRAPQIVLDTIHPPQENAAYFERHLCIDGVGPLNPSEGIIGISATVKTPAQEQALHQMTSEIQQRLTEVEPIFAKYNVTWKKIELKLQRREVIRRRVALYLARFGESHKSTLATKLGELPVEIEDCLQDLTDLHYIQPGEESEHVGLVADNRTFKYLSEQFLRTEDEIGFASSPYLGRCIEKFAFDDFCQQFDAYYDLQEKEDRVLALQSSPTALYLLLFVSEFQIEPTIIPRRAILDGAIWLGFLTDMFRFPQIAQIRGIAPAIMAIQNKIGRESQHLLRLLSALGPDVGRDFRDVFKDLIPPELEDLDSEDKLKFRLIVSHPRTALERGMTFPHLLKAAMISGEPLELVGSSVQLSSTDPRIRRSLDSAISYLVITPHPIKLPPQSGTMFCRVELDHTRRQIILLADIKRSVDYSRYPIAIRMTIPPDGKNATFRPSVYLTNIDVQQALQIDEMFRWIKSGNFHRLRIEPDQAEERFLSDTMPLETLASDLREQTVQPFLDDSYRDILQHLAHLQDKTGERIPFPLGFTTQQEEAIKELDKTSDDMSVTQIRDELLLIAEQSNEDLTTIRVSTYFPAGQIESDEFLGPFPRIVPRIKLPQDEKSPELLDRIQRGEVAFRVTRNFTSDMATFRQKIIEGFSGSEEWSLLPREPESGQTARTACQVTAQIIEDKIWYREQVIHYQIRDISTLSNILSKASHLLKQDQVRGAIDELTNGLKMFPNDHFLTGLLGWAYYRDGDLDAAYEYSLKATHPQDNNKWSIRVDFAYYNLGLFSLLLGRFDESMSWYQEAVRSGAEPVLDESIEDLEAIVTTERPETPYALAFLYEHKGDLKKAVELYGQFLNSDSQYRDYKDLAQAAIRRLHQSMQREN